MLKHRIFPSDIPGWFDFPDIYLQVVREAASPAHFVEVGSCWGASTSFLAWEIRKSRKDIRLDAVDKWEGDGRSICQFNLYRAGLLDRVNLVHEESVKASALYGDSTLDFIFIDADHSYGAVYADIRAWYPKLKPGCLFGGHDYSTGWPGVIEAVHDVFGDAVEVRGSSWIVRKPDM